MVDTVAKKSPLRIPDGMPAKNTIPRPQISSTPVYEEIYRKQEESAFYAQQAIARNLFYRKMEDGERRKVRFLVDFDEALRIKTHTRYEAGAEDNLFDAVCHTMYGIECPICASGNKSDIKYAWPVYLFPSEKEIADGAQHGSFKILLFKHSKMSIVGQLTRYYGDEDYGTLLEHDWTMKRAGKGMKDTFYTVTNKPKAKAINTENLPIPSKEKILELAVRAFNLELYTILEKYELVDGDETWTSENGLHAEEEVEEKTPVNKTPRAQIGGTAKKAAAPAVKATRPADAEGSDEEEEEFTAEALQRLLENEDEE